MFYINKTIVTVIDLPLPTYFNHLVDCLRNYWKLIKGVISSKAPSKATIV